MSDMDERFYSLHFSVLRGYADTKPYLYVDAVAMIDLVTAIANEENQ